MDKMACGFRSGGEYSTYVGRDFLATIQIARLPSLFGDVRCWIRFALLCSSNVAGQFTLGENAVRMVA